MLILVDPSARGHNYSTMLSKTCLYRLRLVCELIRPFSTSGVAVPWILQSRIFNTRHLATPFVREETKQLRHYSLGLKIGQKVPVKKTRENALN